jgi:hypothetical protein
MKGRFATQSLFMRKMTGKWPERNLRMERFLKYNKNIIEIIILKFMFILSFQVVTDGYDKSGRNDTGVIAEP